jgi:hypothetical protein
MNALEALNAMLTEEGRIIAIRSGKFRIDYRELKEGVINLFIPARRYNDVFQVLWQCRECDGVGEVRDLQNDVYQCRECAGKGSRWEDEY